MPLILLALSLITVSGCVGYPPTVSPVQNFEITSYLGKWYEIARLDHSFERGLEQVTAEYTLREDGGINVVNRGFSASKNRWKEAKGKAYFVRGSDEGYLKVSFFGPFYGSYVISMLDQEDYQYALVSGPKETYLWILARTPEIDEELLNRLVEEAKKAGFNTDKLIYVKH